MYDSIHKDNLAQYEILNDPALADPDADASSDGVIQLTEDAARQLVAQVIGPLIDLGLAHLPPNALAHKAHQVALECAYKHHNQFGEVPSKTALLDMATKRVKDRKDSAFLLGEINCILEYLKPDAPAYYENEVRDFAKQYALRRMLKARLAGKKTEQELRAEYVAKCEAVDNWRRIGGAMFSTFADIVAHAKENPITWIIQDWLQLGGLHMISGHSFSGKSVLVSELAASIGQGLPFAGLDTRQTPVLLVDLENGESLIERRFNGKLDTSCRAVQWLAKAAIRDWLPFDAEKIRSLLERFYAASGHSECVLVVDTFRSAFQIDEQDPTAINELLYPLQLVAQECHCGLVLLQHRPKSNADYAGHNAMLAALDFFAKYERDGLNSTLSMVGTRFDTPDDIHFVYETSSRKLLPGSDSTQTLEGSILAVIKNDAAKGLSQSEVILRVQTSWRGSKAPGRDKVRLSLDGLCGQNLVSRQGSNGAGGYTYFPANV